MLGWFVGLLMRTKTDQGVLLNIVAGIAGALIAGWLISPLIGAGSIDHTTFSAPALMLSIFGAIVTLSVFNVFRHHAQN
jgi:uncharacterized membrane protein YeaQ/YmgE (transglycosylase-associated protein family)